MRTLAEFGQGTHSLKFIFGGIDLRAYRIIYKAENRKGIAKLLKEFRACMTELRKSSKENIDQLRRPYKPHTKIDMNFLAAQNPTCIITTRNRANTLRYSKTYKFNLTFNGFVTMRGVMKKKSVHTNEYTNYFRDTTDNQIYF